MTQTHSSLYSLYPRTLIKQASSIYAKAQTFFTAPKPKNNQHMRRPSRGDVPYPYKSRSSLHPAPNPRHPAPSRRTTSEEIRAMVTSQNGTNINTRTSLSQRTLYCRQISGAK